MSTNPALAALRRLPVIFLLAAALLLTALLMLESSGGIAGPERSGVELPFVNTKANQAQQGNGGPPAHCTDGRGADDTKNPHCTGGGGGGGGVGNGGGQSNGNHQKHCTDGRGRDFEKNPHCRGISGAR